MADNPGVAGERNTANNHQTEERFNELSELIGKQEHRIQNLQNSAFQLANYYFVFQGVVLAAVSNTTSLTCSDAWFVFTLSLIAATLNLLALFSIGAKYIRAMDLHDQTWSEYNFLHSLLSPRNLNNRAELRFTGMFSPESSRYEGEQWRDKVSQVRRFVVLGVCMVLFLGFTGVTLSGPWRVAARTITITGIISSPMVLTWMIVSNFAIAPNACFSASTTLLNLT